MKMAIAPIAFVSGACSYKNAALYQAVRLWYDVDRILVGCSSLLGQWKNPRCHDGVFSLHYYNPFVLYRQTRLTMIESRFLLPLCRSVVLLATGC